MRKVGLAVAAAGAAAISSASAQVPDALPAVLLEQHEAYSQCEPLADLVHGEDWQIYALTNDNYLFMVPCAAGAYNFSYAIYIGQPDGTWFQRVLFVDYYDRYGWMGADQLFGAYFNEESLTLSSFYKGRGIGDCGTSGVWQWDEYAFALVAFYAQGECDLSIEPGDFPQVWPPPSSGKLGGKG